MTPTYEETKLWFTPARAARFWRKVNKQANGCWVWTGALTDTGHGRYDFNGNTVRVHRLMWVMARQRDLPDELVIRHLMCDHTPACCNPAHLVGGTPRENVLDMWQLHRPFDEAQEQEAIAKYMKHPFVGYFNEAYGVHTFRPPTPTPAIFDTVGNSTVLHGEVTI